MTRIGQLNGTWIVSKASALTAMLLVSACVPFATAQTFNGAKVIRDHRQGSNPMTKSVRDHRKPVDGGGTPPPPIGDPQPPTNNGDYAGPFAGQTRIDVQEFGRNSRTVANFNMRDQMDLGWLVIRNRIEQQIRFFFKKEPRDHRNRETMESIAGRKLYDLQVTMGDSSRASLGIAVSRAQRAVTLRYSVPDNKMRFRAEVDNFFDPTINISSTINVVVKMKASGRADAPMAVTDAFVEMSNVKASVDGNIIFDVLKKFIEFVKGTDFERKIASAINGRRQDITKDVADGMRLINSRLSEYMAQGQTRLTPTYDRGQQTLVLWLSQPMPEVATQ